MKLKQIIIILDWHFYQKKKKRIRNEFRKIIIFFFFTKEHEAMNIHETRFFVESWFHNFSSFLNKFHAERKKKKKRDRLESVGIRERGVLFTKIMMFADSLPIDPSMPQMISLLWPIKRVFQPKNPPRVAMQVGWK